MGFTPGALHSHARPGLGFPGVDSKGAGAAPGGNDGMGRLGVTQRHPEDPTGLGMSTKGFRMLRLEMGFGMLREPHLQSRPVPTRGMAGLERLQSKPFSNNFNPNPFPAAPSSCARDQTAADSQRLISDSLVINSSLDAAGSLLGDFHL